MDIFERASRSKLRFASMIGMLSTEDLWDLPLTGRGNQVDLDKIARTVHQELKGLEEASFVERKPNPKKIELQLALDIAKHIIQAKLDQQAAAEKRAENEERKRKLLAALAAKEEAALIGMSKEEIEAEIAKIAA